MIRSLLLTWLLQHRKKKRWRQTRAEDQRRQHTQWAPQYDMLTEELLCYMHSDAWGQGWNEQTATSDVEDDFFEVRAVGWQCKYAFGHTLSGHH